MTKTKINTKTKCIVAGILAACSIFSLAACGAASTNSSSSTNSTTAPITSTADKTTYQVDVLRMEAYGGDRGGPNPFLQKSGGPADQKVRYIFDSLLNEGTEKLDAWLANEWDVDGNVYTFKLHEDALWHDGEKVTADDVVFTVSYYQKHTPTSQLIFTGDYNNLTAEKIDEYTVKITAKNNDSTTLGFIGSMFILPKHIWENVDDPMTFTSDDAYIGCGMYKFKSYDSATGAYSYEAFDDYYGPKVASKEIQFVPVSDPLLAFDNGELDISDIAADLADEYAKRDGVGIISKDDDMIYQIYLNHEKVPEFADYEVRKALMQAIDREAIVQNFFRGYGTVTGAGLISPTNTRFYTDDVVKYDYNVESAKNVLSDINLSFTITCPKSYVPMAEIIKMNLAEVGVTVEIEGGVTDMLAKAANGELDAVLSGHGAAARTPSYLVTEFSSDYKNTSSGFMYVGPYGWDSLEITKVANEAMTETDEAKRTALYKELQVLISEELPVIPLCTGTNLSVYDKNKYDGWAKSFDYEQFDYCRVSYLAK